VAETDIPRGWQHPDPESGSGHFRYWDGTRWTAWMTETPGTQMVGFSVHGQLGLHGWRGLWYRRIVRFPLIFYPLAWFNCSVPFTRRRLDRLMRPRETREARAHHRPAR
jgi:hypothetical protein